MPKSLLLIASVLLKRLPEADGFRHAAPPAGPKEDSIEFVRGGNPMSNETDNEW